MEINELINILLKEQEKDRSEFLKNLEAVINYFYDAADENEKEDLKTEFKKLIEHK